MPKKGAKYNVQGKTGLLMTLRAPHATAFHPRAQAPAPARFTGERNAEQRWSAGRRSTRLQQPAARLPPPL